MLGKSPVKVAVAATAIALFAAGCSKATDDPGKPKSGGSIITTSGEPESLIPADSNESEGIAVIQELYSGLTDYNSETGESVNVVAESITSEDARLWTVKLKKNFKFHNGEPVNADSFINAWNFAAYGPNANGNSYFFDRIEGYSDLQSEDPDKDGPLKAPEPKAKTMSGLKKVDDYEFTIQLSVPFGSWPLVVGYGAFYPMAKACLDDIKACNEKPIGNGPFKMDGSWNHKVEIKLVRNDDYAGEKAKIDALTFKIYADIKTAFQDFQAGTIDMIDSVHPSQYKQAKQNYPNNLTENPTSTFAYLGFPLYDVKFKDKVKLRQAFSLAIDRQAVIDAAFDGRYQPADSLVSPVIPGYKAGACEYCKLDVEKAKALLAEAGGWTGGKLKIWFNAGGGHESWTKIIGDQLKKNLGIDYELVGNLQFAEYLGVADAEDFDGPFRLGWSMDYPVMENYLKPLHGCQGSSNNTTICLPEADALIAKGDAASDPKEAAGFYQQAEALMLAQMPVIPVYFGKAAWLKADKVKSVTYNRVTNLDFSTAVVEQ